MANYIGHWARDAPADLPKNENKMANKIYCEMTEDRKKNVNRAKVTNIIWFAKIALNSTAA